MVHVRHIKPRGQDLQSSVIKHTSLPLSLPSCLSIPHFLPSPLPLTRTVKENVVVFKLSKLLFQPVQILYQVPGNGTQTSQLQTHRHALGLLLCISYQAGKHVIGSTYSDSPPPFVPLSVFLSFSIVIRAGYVRHKGSRNIWSDSSIPMTVYTTLGSFTRGTFYHVHHFQNAAYASNLLSIRWYYVSNIIFWYYVSILVVYTKIIVYCKI